jgi:hypothetical protein
MSGSRRITTLTVAGFATALLVSGGLGWAGSNLAAGTARADACNSPGSDSRACPPRGPNHWCPGQSMDPARGGPGTTVVWDTKVCHTWFFVGYGQGNVANNYGGAAGSPNVWDGDDPPAPPPPQCGVPGTLPCSIFP